MRTALFLTALTLLHAYLGRRIVDLTAPLNLRNRRIFSWGLVSLSFVLLVGTQLLYRRLQLPPDIMGLQYLSYLAYFLAGYLVSILCILLPVDVLRLTGFVLGNLLPSLMRLLGRRVPEVARETSRSWFRVFAISRWGLLIGAFVGAVIGLLIVLSGPRIKEIKVVHPGLHPDLEGFRIVQITDLHIGPTVLREDVEEIVSKVNAQRADLIAFTGDLVDGFVDQLASHTESLSGLRARYGVYAVTGNHEYYWGAPEWVEAMEKFGMKVLTDAHTIITVREGRLLIGGVPDLEARRFVSEHASDPVKSLSGAEASDFKVLLAHRPASCFGAEAAGYNLQLSGHTHGGQFIPWAFFVPFAHPYTRGLNRHGSLWVYVSAGTNYWGPPNRFGVPGEITVLTLSSKE